MISKSSEEYLKTMYILKQQNGNVRVTDIAQKMNCTKPSVNKAIYNLKDEGLLNYESYGTIELTDSGENFPLPSPVLPDKQPGFLTWFYKILQFLSASGVSYSCTSGAK